jgi:hypothetical protein
MVLTINPAVSGASRHRFAIHVFTFGLGATLGATATNVCAYLAVHTAARFVPAWSVLAVLLLPLLLVVTRDLGLPVRVPYPQTQVPEWLRHLLPQGVFAPVYGAILGVGFLTRYVVSAHLAAVVGAAFLPHLRDVVVVAAVLALGKTVAFVAAPKRASLAELGREFDRRFYFRPHWRRVLGGASVAVTMATTTVVVLNL